MASADRTPFKDFFNPSSAAASKADALVAAVADVAAQAEFSVDNHFHPQ